MKSQITFSIHAARFTSGFSDIVFSLVGVHGFKGSDIVDWLSGCKYGFIQLSGPPLREN
jgi:hypothetical protein